MIKCQRPIFLPDTHPSHCVMVETPYFHHQFHPFSQPMLPFVLCVSEQPFVFCSTLLPQIEVVNTFKSGTSFQGAGALRRQSSTTSQTQDVTNVSSPSHVSLSNALSSPTSTTAATAPSTTGRESDLCQSASLLFLLQGCHRVVNQNPQAYNHLHFVVGISEVSPLPLFCCPALIILCLSSLLFCCSCWISDSFLILSCFGCTVFSLLNVCVCFLRVVGAQD